MDYIYQGLTKDDLQNAVQARIKKHFPELQSGITRRLLRLGVIYCKGYVKCFKAFVKPPFNDSEIRELLISETTTFIFITIEQKKISKNS